MMMLPVRFECNEIGDTLHLHYSNRALERLCTDEREMKRRRGDIAAKLTLRINALRTAQTIGELPVHDPLGGWHELGADRCGRWAGKLSANWRIEVEPADGAGNDATEVLVADIVDYH